MQSVSSSLFKRAGDIALPYGSANSWLSVLLFTFISICLGFAVTVSIEWLRKGRTLASLRSALTTWPSYVGGIVAALLLWSGVYAVAIARTVNDDEASLKHYLNLSKLTEREVQALAEELHNRPQKTNTGLHLSSCATIKAKRNEFVKILSGFSSESLKDPKFPEMSHVIPFYQTKDKYESDCATEILSILRDATWPLPNGYPTVREWTPDDPTTDLPFTGLRVLAKDPENPPQIVQALRRAMAQIGVRIEIQQWRSVETILIVGGRD
jgi:hypothetical protein